MDCIKLPYSKNQIKRAGEILRSVKKSNYAQIENALKILSVWRTAHACHLGNFNSLIRNKLKNRSYGAKASVSQRLKRFPSIIDKLKRFPTMSLDRMQDIAGMRVVLPNVADVLDFHKAVSVAHGDRKKVRENDYISHPKIDGYRSVHSVYACYNKACRQLDGLRVELQIRTQLQHSWGTAVETLGILTNSSIKTGRGSEEDSVYFKLVSALFSIEEKTTKPEKYADFEKPDIVDALKKLDAKIKATSTLEAAAESALKIISPSSGKADYHLIELDTAKRYVSITPYAQEQLVQAEEDYNRREQKYRDNPDVNVVLVSVGSVKDLQKAYPNFFLDTKDFVKKVRRYLAE